MSRTYSSPTYGADYGTGTDFPHGARRHISFQCTDMSAIANASAAALGSVRFMFPCEVVAFNMVCEGSSTDYSSATNWVLSHRLAGATGCTEFGTIDLLEITATYAPGGGAAVTSGPMDGTVCGGTASQAFNAGDDCVLEFEGTGESSGVWTVNLEVIEKFQEGDS